MKVLDLILKLKDDLYSDWKPALIEINIWEDVKYLYHKYDKERDIANVILAFIILSYDKKSPWLDIHMDRIDNKERIMISLAGENFKTKLPFVTAILGDSNPICDIVEWYINYQLDRRWKTIMADLDYHAKATMISKQARDFKDMTEVGKMMGLAEVRRQNAEAMLEELRAEMVNIDHALEQEGKPKMTDRFNETFNFMSHEQHLLHKKAMEELQRAAELGNPGNGDIMNEYEDSPI